MMNKLCKSCHQGWVIDGRCNNHFCGEIEAGTIEAKIMKEGTNRYSYAKKLEAENKKLKEQIQKMRNQANTWIDDYDNCRRNKEKLGAALKLLYDEAVRLRLSGDAGWYEETEGEALAKIALKEIENDN